MSDRHRDLWAAVLHATIEDAVYGAPAGKSPIARKRETLEARRYLTEPNKDFNEVCHLAGLDPMAVRERAAKLIAKAPSIDELFPEPIAQADAEVEIPRVSSNFQGLVGTGAGSTLQAAPNIAFQKDTD